MTGSDDDFENFLKQRKPVFRAPDDMFEPPAELDRVVLRQAREAIETERPLRVFRNPRWATPVALAATLVLAFTVLFYAGLPQKRAPVPEVTVQNVAEEIPMEAAPAIAANKQRESADRAPPPPAPPAAPSVARAASDAVAPEPGMAPAPMAAASAAPNWRRDAKTWLAEIERLRDAGDTARADAELAEYKRQQRAYAGTPDR